MGAQLNIKSDEAYELATKIAQRDGVSLTRAVLDALRARQWDLTKEERFEEVMGSGDCGAAVSEDLGVRYRQGTLRRRNAAEVIVDSSAIVAMLKGEPEAASLVAALLRADETVISAANYLEAGIVIDGERDVAISARLDRLARSNIEVVAVTPSQARLARQAYRDFGKGSGHPAKLNFGDCFAYGGRAGGAVAVQGRQFYPHRDRASVTAGVQAIFGPGTNLADAADEVLRLLGHNKPPVEEAVE